MGFQQIGRKQYYEIYIFALLLQTIKKYNNNLVGIIYLYID